MSQYTLTLTTDPFTWISYTPSRFKPALWIELQSVVFERKALESQDDKLHLVTRKTMGSNNKLFQFLCKIKTSSLDIINLGLIHIRLAGLGRWFGLFTRDILQPALFV